MEAYNKKPRILFIITGLPVLLISVVSMYLYFPVKHENAEYARLTNQGILLFILVIFHFLGGWLSLKWNIDYCIYKPLAACICWNSWLLICLVWHTNSIILQRNEMWSVWSARLTCLVTFLILWQISVHWNLYKNGQQNQEQQKQEQRKQD
ncbi:uncharacterized protein LOC123541184 isoform X2 [Mercenaria mercenaria]|uniref:uncharacterized protein LOC123541184 isoform X2 n=1 Tax=Mercenaria mercenaria TaxID=6596 RepID=UPI00234EFD10|nr:uncharacterized protein LOC123541184 isoform X2 [Mercenaria mercenaria]XP_053383154.1 uncharacterized protein LOC123541184 isoform X2 [Mercenaria mercenaria]XP_053383155.1 uncharacterized protein LOC123541184 isoform X2 [Mercenaria mercenaria]XP_053383156.1 uncharacterized protein LOC123541184 isoform X2 [Mercenaria mercenaria]